MIKKTLLKSWLLLLCMVVGVGSAWAADGDTHDFAQDFSQLLNNNASISPINIDAQNYSVKKVVVSYRYNKTITNAVTVEVSVGGTSWGSQYVNGTGKDYTTLEFGGDATEGAIKITFTNNAGDGTGKGTFYVNNVRLVEGASSGGSSAVATTTAIDATGITNTDIYSGTAAGSLSAAVTVTEGGEAIDGATVTWSGDNDGVATINASTGAVTLVAAGTVTFTATYAGVEDEYQSSSDTYELTVTDSTPLPTYTVTFGDEGSVTQETPGAEVTLPSRSEKAGYAFAGWSETNVTEETTTDPGIIPAGSYTPTANITLYPVYTKTEGGSAPSAFAVGDTGNYAIVAEDNGKYYALPTNPTVNSGKIAAQAITVSEIDDVKFVTPANATGFTWTIAEATNGYTISDGSNYIYHSNGGASGTNLAYGDLTTYTWSFTADEGGYIKMASMSGSTTNGRGLLFNSNNKAIGGYALSNWDNSSYCKTMILPIANAGTTYYWSAPVAAAVERPEIVVAQNPFTISTTVTITCETENAAIKYSFDGKTWNDYSSPFAIDATTTIYAKAIKEEKESTVATVTATKSLIVPTVNIDNSGITNTDVYVGTEAGSLAATVIYEEAVPGAVVTWSGNNDEVATINAETGVVTLVAAGTVTFTATYAGNSDYAEKTATYEMTVTNSDPNVPGTENNPYTVAEIIDFIETLGGETSAEVFVKGIISQIDSYNSKYSSITYWISDDGTTTTQFECYSGLGLNSAKFSSINDLQLGDEVVVAGTAKKYGDVYEFNYNNYIVSLVRVEKPVAPTFSVAEGTYTESQSVELSTTTEEATIYYTTNGDEPTTESTEYTEAIVVTETTTIKAIAVKNDVASDVATATYTINTTPFVTVAQTAIEAEAAGKDGTIEVTYNNMTQDEFAADVVYCDAEGNEVTDATYGWIIASINKQTNNIDYLIEENTSTEARTAYIKVYALYDDDDYFSDIITFTQAGMVVDYATLPFEYDGNATGELPTGLTQEGLGTKTYANSPKIGFDTTGDELVLKINEAPGSLFFDIKGNSFSEGTFTVQTSVDGVDYTDLKAYTDLGATQTEIFNLNADVRYIKWVYTEKVNGNVALGNIKVSADAAVTIGAAKYATFSNNRATDFSKTGITVYTAKVNGNYVTLTKVEDGIVPANTGVVLYSETAKTYEVPFTTTENSLENNDLLISDGTIDGDGSTIFALANKNQGVGFYRVANEVAVPAGKPYLQIANAAREFFGFGSETTSINGALSIKNGASVDAPVYNLNGQRILKPAKGLYIVNGKKAVIK